MEKLKLIQEIMLKNKLWNNSLKTIIVFNTTTDYIWSTVSPFIYLVWVGDFHFCIGQIIILIYKLMYQFTKPFIAINEFTNLVFSF